VSKAFTSEEAPDLGPVIPPVPRPRPGELRPVTPEGAAELRARLERLRAERARAATDVDRARLGARIAALEATLAALAVKEPELGPGGEAGFGAWVTVEDAAGARRTWRLVGPDEADAARGLVSVRAPLGLALLGRRAGETTTVERPDGPAELDVKDVRRAAP
jgi:transcription elongation factor GreB